MDIELALAHKDHEARRNKLIGKIELALPENTESITLEIYHHRVAGLLREIKEFLEEGDI